MAAREVTREEVDALVARFDEAAGAFVRGDKERYVELAGHGEEFTLQDPLGGPARRLRDRGAGARDAPPLFTSGEATLEHVETHAWGDTVVISAIERQRGEADGRREQDWSLRVTLVLRRADERWTLVHRHADPLVRRISFDRLAELAGG